jgi:hypothetical protein
MKKIYTVVAAAILCGTVSAQVYDTVTFESHSLSTNSFDNGSAGNGDFQFSFLSLTNFYDAAWGSWSGFSISNVTDNTTAGWGNQYSAFTGSGLNSENYGVYYPDGTISMGNFADVDLTIDSFYVTNTSYAAISMRDGDAFSKQFGSIYAADGTTVDGTNGEDFFRLWVIGESFSGSQKDSVEVYLADYRFSDNSQDFILDTWKKVDLTGFGFPVAVVKFKMESSDNGAWGMNTPAYFSLDNIFYNVSLGLQEKQLDISTYPNPVQDVLIVKGENGTLVLRDVKGNSVLSMDHNEFSTINTSMLSSGIYFLEVSNSKGKAVQKIIK